MKQITFNELKQICGCKSNNDFANDLLLYMDATADDADFRGFKDCGKLLRRRSNNIYSKLQELGYYEGV